MLGHHTQQARLQGDFYRYHYHRVLNRLLYLNVLTLLLIFALIYVILLHPGRHYYATSPDGKIIPLVLKNQQ